VWTSTPVRYEQTVRGRVARRGEGSVSVDKYTGTLSANSQGTSGQAGRRVGECGQVHRYAMSKQSGDEWPGREKDR
jgi:hypothetical protein